MATQKRKTKNCFSRPIIDAGKKILQNAPREHSEILSTFIKLPFVFKSFVLCIFEWPHKTGFTVDPDEMPHNATFRLGLHCLPKYSFRHHQYTKGSCLELSGDK